MTKQPAPLQLSLSQMLSAQPSKKQNALSVKQKSDGEAFLRIFPSERAVLAYFAPAKWAAAIANADKCTCHPCMTLYLLDRTYSEGLAIRLVENNIRGLYSFARPNEPIIDNVVKRVAELFVAKYGSELSVFGTLLYFAQYITDHKSSYGQFDLVDVLKQCSKSFLPKWRQRLGKAKEKEAKLEEGCREAGTAALYTYLRQEYVAKGIDIRTAPIVKLFKFTEKELQFIESGEPLQL